MLTRLRNAGIGVGVVLTVTCACTSGSLEASDPPVAADSSSTALRVEDASPAAPRDSVISWQDLKQLRFALNGDVVVLDDGEAKASHEGSSDVEFMLRRRVARGDLDDDGDDDLIAHISQSAAGMGDLELIVPVFNEAGTPDAAAPVMLGRNVVVQEVSIREGLAEVVLLDRRLGDPVSAITQRSTLEADLSGGAPRLRVANTEPIELLPPHRPAPPDIEVGFETGATQTMESGSIEFRGRQTYLLEASDGQPITVTLDAPAGVWLDARLGKNVLVSAMDRSQRISATLPAAGLWRIAVLSFRIEPADYELTVEALPIKATGTSPRAVPEPHPSTIVPRVEAGSAVYLTFDDGPNPQYTPQILDVLRRHGARATFFVVGSLTKEHPELIDRIIAEGHTVANHTWNHENLAYLDRDAFDETVSRTQHLLGANATPCLRPPYGAANARTAEWAASHGLALIYWTLDSKDWTRPGVNAIANRIVEGARKGTIVLMHDGGGDRAQTVQALDLALSRLAEVHLTYEPLCPGSVPLPDEQPEDAARPDDSEQPESTTAEDDHNQGDADDQDDSGDADDGDDGDKDDSDDGDGPTPDNGPASTTPPHEDGNSDDGDGPADS